MVQICSGATDTGGTSVYTPKFGFFKAPCSQPGRRCTASHRPLPLSAQADNHRPAVTTTVLLQSLVAFTQKL